MITQKQLEHLAKYYRIDTFTILREYLQILFLSYLYREREASKIYFKGGTAIRLLFNSPRFSEDLDFSTLFEEKVIRSLIIKLEKSIQTEIPEIIITPLYFGKNTSRFRLIFKSDESKYPSIIRLDFNRVNKSEKIIVSPLVTKYPIMVFPLICHLSEKEILAEKICAMLTRAKGRDFFDVWYLLEKEIPVSYDLLKYKLRESGIYLKIKEISEKIKSHPNKQLELDLKQFLPATHRPLIGTLLNRLSQKFDNL